MTDPSPLPDLPADLVDELLSALLDGELPAAAVDAGLDPDSTAARLEASGAARRRLAELATARDALAAPDEPLDELARRRMLDATPSRPTSTASAARRDGRPRRRSFLVGAAAAAALLLAVGTIAVTRSSSGGGHATSSAARHPIDLGSIADAAALRSVLEQRLGGSRAGEGRAGSGASADVTPFGAGRSASTPRERSAAPATTTPVPPTGPGRTLAACVASLEASAPPRLVALATYGGRAAYVVAFDTAGRTLAYVVARADCTILTSQSF